MKAAELTVKRIPRARKYKFGVYAGQVCITSHITEDQANDKMINNASFYEYWAGSPSVMVDNSKKNVVTL